MSVSAAKFLLVKGRAGLGNRLDCALSAVLYSRLTGRKLVIDWCDPAYSSDGRNAFHHYFLCDLCPPEAIVPPDASARPLFWQGALRESARDVHERVDPKSFRSPLDCQAVSIDLSRIDWQEDVLVMCSYTDKIQTLRRHLTHWPPELRWLSRQSVLRKLLHDHFTLHPAIQQRVDAIRSAWPKKPMIGVHVRYLDKKSRLPHIHAKLRSLLKRRPDSGIFIATDNASIQESFSRDFPGVVAAAKWFPATGISMHNNQGCSDRLANGVEALVDLYLLAGCDDLVIDESSAFSHIAALLSRLPANRIINVQRGAWIPSSIRRALWVARQRIKLRQMR